MNCFNNVSNTEFYFKGQFGLKSIIRLVVVISILVLYPAANALAQSASNNYSLTISGPIGGGGTSASASFALTGNVPLTGSGVSASGSYVASGGLIGPLTDLTQVLVSYDRASIESVENVQQILKVSYSGGTGTALGTIHYRQGGQLGDSSAQMSAGTGDTLIYNFPASLLGMRGVEYYFTITRDASTINIGTAQEPYVFVVELDNAEAQRPVPMPEAQYRIIGLPFDPNSASASTVFTDDLGSADKTVWRLGSFNSGTGTVSEFPSVSTVIPGRGYWLIARGGLTYGSAGSSVRPTQEHLGNPYYVIDLDSGWNLVANPFAFNVSFAEILIEYNGTIVTGHPDSLIDNAFYWYNGASYQNVTNIPSWDGGFIFAHRDGISVWVRYRQSSSKAPTADKPFVSENSNDWFVELKLESNGLIDDANFAGVKSDALTGSDKYDLSEPPPAPNAPYLAFKLPENGNRLRRIDMRPEISDGLTWDIEISEGSNRILTLNGLNNLETGYYAALAFDNGTTIYPSDGIELILANEIKSARLVIGNKGYLEDEEVSLPLRYALNQNYPNPFNPVTSIMFTIPEAGHVQLNVHNILGQLVKTLINSEMEKGEYTITWDGKDENGMAVASGIYFYRISANEFTHSRKMILLK
ncbi:MAG: FlgD immunoglobulin-like domain containing protein [Candidatus Zixiibacteriota bacterium]